jgi:hypothetical protein
MTAVAWVLLILWLATLFTLATEWLRACGEQDRAEEAEESLPLAEAEATYWRTTYHNGVGRLIADLHAPTNVVSLWRSPAAGRIADRVAANEARRLDDEIFRVLEGEES